MNIPITNRADSLPVDGWYQIEAPGEHVNHAAQVVQVIDAKAIASIINRFNAAALANPNFAGQRIDRDHLSNSMENPTEALGWAMELRSNDGIPEARIDWTSLGLPLVAGKVYKFFSTEYDPGACQELGERMVNGESYKILRPLALAGLALTNDPNNKGQRPISNRRGAGSPGHEAGKAAAEGLYNRAMALKAAAPTRSFDSCWQQARSETAIAQSNTDQARVQRISNRATELKATASARSFDSCWQQARSEAVIAQSNTGGTRVQRISNRTAELKAAAQHRTFDSCWQQAQRELSPIR